VTNRYPVSKPATTIAQQQQDIQDLTANLKSQAAQIQKVSDQRKTRAPVPRAVLND
jgi:hypothetical protein